MELVSNQHADFTRWVIKRGLLHEPLVVIDVGVQGGENLRWHALGDHLIVHGFDPIESVIEQLRATNRRSNVTYHNMALGNAEGTMELFINKADPYSSSMYRHGESRFERREPVLNVQRVTVRRLDALIDEGIMPRPDFLKVDVEGFEGDVLQGASRHLDNLCGFEVESNFGISDVYRETHFGRMMGVALAHRLLVFDLELNRVPTIAFQEALTAKRLDTIGDHASVGKPAMLNVLFARDLVQEADYPELYATPAQELSADFLIKQMAVFELYGLNDIAVDIGRRFAAMLGKRLDVDRAVHLLADPHCRVPGGRTAVRAKSEEEAARRAAIERRVAELRDEVEMIRGNHVSEVLRLERVWEFERLAARQRIEQLELELDEFRKAHAETVERISKQSTAERQASDERIHYLEQQMAAERLAAQQRIVELDTELTAIRETQAATIARLRIRHLIASTTGIVAAVARLGKNTLGRL